MQAQLENITFHYEVLGEGRPIIMLHGGIVDHRQMMNDLEPVLGPRLGWQRIYPDLPGHGETAGEAWITNHDHILEVVVDFIDHVIPGQRFVLVGTSWGGHLAQGIVHRRAALMDGLLLNVPAIEQDFSKRILPPPVTFRKDPKLLAELEPELVPWLQPEVVQDEKLVAWLRTNFVPGQAVMDKTFTDKIWAPDNYKYSFDVDTLPQPFGGPTLILLGRQDTIVGYRDQWRIIEEFPRATFAILDRAGHFMVANQGGLFSALVNEWLDRVEEYIKPEALS